MRGSREFIKINKILIKVEKIFLHSRGPIGKGRPRTRASLIMQIGDSARFNCSAPRNCGSLVFRSRRIYGASRARALAVHAFMRDIYGYKRRRTGPFVRWLRDTRLPLVGCLPGYDCIALSEHFRPWLGLIKVP